MGLSDRRRRRARAAVAVAAGLLTAAGLTSTAAADSSGPNAPDVAANQTGIGTVAWSNPASAKASDDTHSYAGLVSSTSNYLKLTDFDLGVPAGSTITGVAVSVERSAPGPGDIRDASVRLVKASTVTGSNRAATGTSWPTSPDGTAGYGSGSDLWGTTLSVADVNSTGFGVAIAAENLNGSATFAKVDSVTLTVHYTTGGGPPPGGSTADVAVNATGFGTVAWSQPGDGRTSNDAHAYAGLVSSTSNYLKLTDFDFAVPAGETITGVTVGVERYAPGPGDIRDVSVRLVKGSSITGSNRAATGTSWPTGADATATYGSDSDLWGTTLTPSDVNGTGFGVAIAAENLNGSGTFAKVDAVTVTVHTDGSGPPPGPDSVYVASHARDTMYASSQNPGYTSWVGASFMTDGSILMGFTQSTGPTDPNQRTLAPQWVYDAMGNPNYPAERDHWGLDNTVRYLRSTDGGGSWSSWRVDDLETPDGYPTIHPIPFTPQAHIVLGDGDVLRRVNGEDIRYDSTIEATAYIQRLTSATGTWSAPKYLLDPDESTYQISRIRELSDGRLIALGQEWDAPAGTRTGSTPASLLLLVSGDDGLTWTRGLTNPDGPPDVYPNEWDVAELPDGDLLAVHRSRPLTGGTTQVRLQSRLEQNGSQWTMTDVESAPFPHSGHPELLATEEGAVLHVATTGISYTLDEGDTWHDLESLTGTGYPSEYYPRALQDGDGTVYVFGHDGFDDDYGERDQSIVLDTLELGVD